MIAILGRDFGPMLAAERRAAAVGTGSKKGTRTERPRALAWLNTTLPVFIVVAVTVWLILRTGRESLGDAAASATLRDVFGNGNSYLALVYASLAGWLSAATLARINSNRTWQEIKADSLAGASHVIAALGILWLSWSLSGLTTDEFLGTKAYLGELVTRVVDPRWMPTIVFILASAVSFSTGTSWGTMGILMPLAIPATYAAQTVGGVPPDINNPILIGTIGAVLAGAIFGDHCSPISDTTVLSSQASGCDHMAHVRTQMPYALIVAAAAVVCGTIPIGFGVPVWASLIIGPAALLALLFLIGKKVEVNE